MRNERGQFVKGHAAQAPRDAKTGRFRSASLKDPATWSNRPSTDADLSLASLKAARDSLRSQSAPGYSGGAMLVQRLSDTFDRLAREAGTFPYYLDRDLGVVLKRGDSWEITPYKQIPIVPIGPNDLPPPMKGSMFAHAYSDTPKGEFGFIGSNDVSAPDGLTVFNQNPFPKTEHELETMMDPDALCYREEVLRAVNYGNRPYPARRPSLWARIRRWMGRK